MKNIVLFILILIPVACAPAPTPLLSPTIAATRTLAPTLTSTSTPTATASPTPVPPNGPCDNPLVPLAVGNQWTYHAITESGESIFTLKSLERQDKRNIIVLLEFTNQKSGETVQEPVVCLDGAIENFPLFVMDMLFSDYLGGLFNTYHDTGIYAPAYETFLENNWILNWDARYLTEDAAYIKNPLGASDLFVLQSSPMDLYFEMDGMREVVIVPAGEYPQAIKVSHIFNLTATVTLPTGPTSGEGGLLTFYTTHWYEPYVGLVRAYLDSASLRIGGTQEFNVPMQSTLELLEFNAGN